MPKTIQVSSVLMLEHDANALQQDDESEPYNTFFFCCQSPRIPARTTRRKQDLDRAAEVPSYPYLITSSTAAAVTDGRRRIPRTSSSRAC